jgi:hypothetical protein
MIVLGWSNVSGDIAELMRRYNELPRSIAKKHLQAAMKRAGKTAVPLLKKNTPKGGTRTVGSNRKRGGSLRRAATFVARYKGRNRDGSVFGILGYKYGMESRKAIWLEFGTTRGIEPRDIVKKTYTASKGIIASRLEAEMVLALTKATNEANSPMNPRMSRRGSAAGIAPQ